MDELDSDLEQCLKDWTDLSDEYAVSYLKIRISKNSILIFNRFKKRFSFLK